jgi:hypothetical protein
MNWKRVIGWILIIIASLYAVGTPGFEYWKLKYGSDVKLLILELYLIGLIPFALIFLLGLWILKKYKK